jgi:hypothetical protein
MRLSRIALFVVLSSCIFLTDSSMKAVSLPQHRGEIVDDTRTEDPEVRSLSDTLAHYIMGALYDNFGDTSQAISEYEKALAYDEERRAGQGDRLA